MPSNKDPTRVEAFLNWLQTHKLTSVLVILGICVIALGNFFTSLQDIIAFFRPEPSAPATVSSESPVAIPSPVSATIETAATPQPVITSFSPAKMIAEVVAARSLQRDDVAKAFIGLSVDWNLFFIDGNAWGDEEYFLKFSDSPNGEIIVDGMVPKAQNPGLHLTEKGTPMRVRGIVNHVTDRVVVLNKLVISPAARRRAKRSQ